MAETPRTNAEELLEHSGWARTLAKRVLKDGAAAEDAVQEAWLAALRHPPPADGRLRPWIARVVLNFARQSRRGESRRTSRERGAARSELVPSAGESASKLEAQRALVDAIEALEEPYRTTVILRYFDGLTCAQIARSQGVPAGTVRWRLQHALGELRGRLDRRFDGDRSAWALVLLPFVRRPPIVEIAAASAASLPGAILMSLGTKAALACAAVIAATIVYFASTSLPGAPVGAAPDEPEGVVELEPVVAVEATTPESPGASRVASSAAVETPAPAVATAVVAKTRVLARFVDEAGNPIRGVHCRLVDFEGFEPSDSGADGRAVVLVELEQRRGALLEAACPRWATFFQRISLEPGRDTDLGDLALEPGGSIAGRVLGPDETPFAGARVVGAWARFIEHDGMARLSGPQEWDGVLAATSAVDGSFRIDGVAPHSMRVWAGAENMRFAYSEPIEVTPGGVHDGVVLRLVPLAREDRIGGIVLLPDGTPAAAKEVWFETRVGGLLNNGYVVTSADGRFEFKLAFAERPHEVKVVDPEDRWQGERIEDVAPGTLDLVLHLREKRRLELHVQGQEGEPVESFHVELTDNRDRNRLLGPDTEEHPGGDVVVDLPDVPFRIEIVAKGHATADLGTIDPVTAPGRLTCDLRALPGIRGRVLVDGRPISGARVNLRRCLAPGAAALYDDFATRLEWTPEDTDTTDSEGRFELTVRELGSFAIFADAEGFPVAELSPLEVDPAVGREGVEMSLSRGGSIEGRLVLEGGADPADRIVGINRFDGRPLTARVGSDGAYRFDGLTPGPWQVRLAKYEVAPQARSFQRRDRGSESLFETNCIVEEGRVTRFDLEPGDLRPCVIDARVTANGRPAAGWTLRVLPEAVGFMARRIPEGELDKAGAARVEIDEPGRYRIRLQPPLSDSPSVTFQTIRDLARGENPISVDLEFGSIEGSVSGFGPSVIGRFTWESGDLSFEGEADIQADGKFRLPVVAAGRGKFAVHHGQGQHWEKGTEIEVVVTPGQTARVQIP